MYEFKEQAVVSGKQLHVPELGYPFLRDYPHSPSLLFLHICLFISAGSQLRHTKSFQLQLVGSSSLARDRTQAPALGTQSLNR